VHLPHLVLDAVAGGEATGPVAIVELDGRVQRVVAANERARERGIAPGLALAAALALVPALEARPRDPEREAARLHALGVRSLGFTPRVALEPPDGVLLEVRGSLALFGGAECLLEAIEETAGAEGVRVHLALAPTPLAALAGARAGANLRLLGPGALVGALASLPLAVLRWPPELLARLAKAGVRTLGQVLRLPRAGLARRFGAALPVALDRLTGTAPDVRPRFAGGERFHMRAEPTCEIADHAALVAFLTPCFESLERFLRSRQGGIALLEARLRHRRTPATRVAIGFAQPAFEARAMAALFAQRLATIQLPEPVIACALRSGAVLGAARVSGALWRPGEHGGGAVAETNTFLERLHARLGAGRVHGLCLVPEHRPEVAWRPVDAPRLGSRAREDIGMTMGCESPWRRPLWLLREPELLRVARGRPCHDAAPLELLNGPECLETGWWDGADIARDYYVARDAGDVRLWVYRERVPPHAWYLHGVFG
jgi:protein ImuB